MKHDFRSIAPGSTWSQWRAKKTCPTPSAQPQHPVYSHTLQLGSNTGSVADPVKNAHGRVVRMFRNALTLNTSETWIDFAVVLAVRLVPRERVCLSYAALRSLDMPTRTKVAEAALSGAGMPLPTFVYPRLEATLWAVSATPTELEAYCLEAFRAMPRKRQQDFIDYARRRFLK